MRISKILFNGLILLCARPKFQKFFEFLFRINLSFLGFMNWSADFKLTGEKLALKELSKFGIFKVLDIGANKGQWAKLALDTLGCEVISIEPQNSAFVELSSLRNQYGSKITVFNLAIGDANKEVFINVHASSDELSYIDGRLKNMPLLSGKSEVQELVNMMTLDSLFQAEPELLKNVDLIKIDTEGFEFNETRKFKRL